MINDIKSIGVYAMTVTSHIGNIFSLLVVSTVVLSTGAPALGQSRGSDPRTRGGRYVRDTDPGFGREAERVRLNAEVDFYNNEGQSLMRRKTELLEMLTQLDGERQSILRQREAVGSRQDAETLERLASRDRSYRIAVDRAESFTRGYARDRAAHNRRSQKLDADIAAYRSKYKSAGSQGSVGNLHYRDTPKSARPR